MTATFILSILTLVIIVAIGYYYSDLHTLAKLAILPVAILVVTIGYMDYNYHLGEPIRSRPLGEFNYVTHVDQGGVIIMTATTDIGMRLYVFEGTEEERKALNGAMRKIQNGIEVEGEFKQGVSDETEGRLEFWPAKETIKEGYEEIHS